MYGMVHQALQEWVSARTSGEVWTRVCRSAGVEASTTLSLNSYPDETTYKLVIESAKELNLPLEVLLREFGQSWIDFALRTAYGALLRNSGSTLFETLNSLDSMHTRLQMALPKLQPPSFQANYDDGTIVLRYYSTRPGLGPFVIGLVEGLATMHKTRVQVEHTGKKSDGADHDEFRISTIA